MDDMLTDLRQAARGLRRDKGFTALTVGTLAIGIGLNAAVFSVVRPVLLGPLPYPDADQLVVVWTAIPSEGVTEATSAYANVQDWSSQTRAFEDLATFDPTTLTLGGYDMPEQVMGIRASANLFDVMAVPPQAGRWFNDDEETRRAAVVVASAAFAELRFGSAAGAIGATVQLAGVDFELIGVMPAGLDTDARFWLPQTLFTDWDAQSTRRGTDAFQVLGRLRPGVTLEEAHSDLSAIAARLAAEHPQNDGLGVRLVSLYDQVTGASFRLALWTLFGAVGIVLLIACANAAHLILARGLERARDVAVRTALGASTPRLLRQALTETFLLAALAGVVGAGLAWLTLPWLVSFAPAEMPRASDVALNVPVLVYLVLVSIAVGLLCGIVPIVAGPRLGIYQALREGRGVTSDRGRLRGRRLLITGQLALSLVLVFTASLLLRSFVAARGVDPGFVPEGVLMTNLSVEAPEERIGFYHSVVESVSGLPGVSAAGVIEDLFIGGAPNRVITVEGRATDLRTELRIDAIAGDVFGAVGVALRAGRSFVASDGETAPVAVVNETMAMRFWPGATAVGQRFRTGAADPWIEIVGVVADMHRQGPERAPIAQVFVPYAQAPSRNMNLLVRADIPTEALTASIRERVAAVNRSVPLYGVGTLVAGMDRFVAERRLQTFLLGTFSSIALALAALGIYGLVQYSVSRRTRELGVRVALGAYAGELQRMVLREAVVLALPGAALGAVGSIWIAEALAASLFEVAPADPVSVAVTASALVLSTILAAYLPARRASRVDPVRALRGD